MKFSSILCILTLTLVIFSPSNAFGDTTTLAGGLYAPAGIAVHDGHLYFTECMCDASGAGAIKKVSINGGSVTILASGLAYPFGITLDDTYIYFSQNSVENGAIRKIPIAGGQISDIVTGLDVPHLIAKDSNYIYWSEGRMGNLCVIKKIPLLGGSVTVLASGLSESPLMIALDSNYVYWIDNGNLYKVSKDGGQSTVLANDLLGSGTVAVDSEFAYWSESGTGQNDGSIKKVSTDGGTSTTLVSGLNSFACIGIDSSYLYWVEGFEINSDKTTGSLKKVPLTGVTIETLAIGLNAPRFLVVDNDFIYWSEGTIVPNAGCPTWPPQNGTIKKAKKRTSIVDVNGDGKVGLEEAVYALQVVAGIRLPYNDEEEIRANFAAAVDAINSKDINTLMSYFSPNYIDDGYDYNAQRQNFEEWFLDPDFEQISYTINSINISGSNATVSVTWYDGETEEMYWIKESGDWKLYGNQEKYRVRVYSAHESNGYNACFYVEDPDHNATSVAVTGPGISGSMALEYTLYDGRGRWSQTSHPFFGEDVPTESKTYTITVNDETGSHVYEKTITGYVTQFATNLSPTGEVSGTITFSWAGIPGASYYCVELSDSNYNRIWNAYNIPSTTTSVVYDGPSLTPGETYYYRVLSIIETDGVGNISVAKATFIFTG